MENEFKEISFIGMELLRRLTHGKRDFPKKRKNGVSINGKLHMTFEVESIDSVKQQIRKRLSRLNWNKFDHLSEKEMEMAIIMGCRSIYSCFDPHSGYGLSCYRQTANSPTMIEIVVT